MTILTRKPTSEQIQDDNLVEAGLKDGDTHEVIKDIGHGEYLTRCGERIAFGNIVLTRRPRSEITCQGCHLGNDADFRARASAK